MGVTRIPVGGIQQSVAEDNARDFFMSRDWRAPSFPMSDYTLIPGRRVTGLGATLVVTNEKLWGTSHHFNMPAGANNYFEIGEGWWHRPSIDIDEGGAGSFAYEWRVGITLEKAGVGGAGGPAGECFQGVGYGAPLVANPPFIGATFIAPFFQLIWNYTLSQWELIAFSGNNPTFKKVLAKQPTFISDGSGFDPSRYRHIELRWVPGSENKGNRLQAWIDNKFCDEIVDSRIDGLSFQQTYPIGTYVACTGSNALTTLINLGYYYWRIYQPMEFDPDP